eukprot:Skav227553  [mRNA]  locus=scaffold3241:32649:34812:+ [translate_table: standard]
MKTFSKHPPEPPFGGLGAVLAVSILILVFAVNSQTAKVAVMGQSKLSFLLVAVLLAVLVKRVYADVTVTADGSKPDIEESVVGAESAGFYDN